MPRTKRKPIVVDEPEVTKETKQDKLYRLSQARVTAAINRIRLVGNLSAYKPTDAQVDAIMEALGEACARIDARLRGTKKDAVPFTLTRVA